MPFDVLGCTRVTMEISKGGVFFFGKIGFFLKKDDAFMKIMAKPKKDFRDGDY